jgi:hypothetical protein
MDSWLTSTMLSNKPGLFPIPRNGANTEVQVKTYWKQLLLSVAAP